MFCAKVKHVHIVVGVAADRALQQLLRGIEQNVTFTTLPTSTPKLLGSHKVIAEVLTLTVRSCAGHSKQGLSEISFDTSHPRPCLSLSPRTPTASQHNQRHAAQIFQISVHHIFALLESSEDATVSTEGISAKVKRGQNTFGPKEHNQTILETQSQNICLSRARSQSSCDRPMRIVRVSSTTYSNLHPSKSIQASTRGQLCGCYFQSGPNQAHILDIRSAATNKDSFRIHEWIRLVSKDRVS